MPQFSLKRLLVGTMAIAVGLAMFSWMYQIIQTDRDFVRFRTVIAFWVTGGTVICAGVLVPFKRGIIGALFGFIVQSGLAVYLYGMLRGA
jgi:hypothetical protein